MFRFLGIHSPAQRPTLDGSRHALVGSLCNGPDASGLQRGRSSLCSVRKHLHLFRSDLDVARREASTRRLGCKRGHSLPNRILPDSLWSPLNRRLNTVLPALISASRTGGSLRFLPPDRGRLLTGVSGVIKSSGRRSSGLRGDFAHLGLQAKKSPDRSRGPMTLQVESLREAPARHAEHTEHPRFQAGRGRMVQVSP